MSQRNTQQRPGDGDTGEGRRARKALGRHSERRQEWRMNAPDGGREAQRAGQSCRMLLSSSRTTLGGKVPSPTSTTTKLPLCSSLKKERWPRRGA